MLKRKANYFYSKANKRFTTKRGKLKSKNLIYAVFATDPALKIRTKSEISKLFTGYLKELKALGLVPANFNYLKFFNLNVKAIKKIGKIFHIDFICNGDELSSIFFKKWKYGTVKVQKIKKKIDLKNILSYVWKQMEDYYNNWKNYLRYGLNQSNFLFRFSPLNI